MTTICCVLPSIRPQHLAEFKQEWKRLFESHRVTVVAVLDGDEPLLEVDGKVLGKASAFVEPADQGLFFNRSDCCRNYGFYYAAKYLNPQFVYTLDDDCFPIPNTDPIAEHLSILNQPVPLSWMNTGNGVPFSPFYRGVPYKVRLEGKVAASHGTWLETPDLDAPTQLTLTGKIDTDPDFFRGPIPKNVLAPVCGMNLMVTREALPLLYFAPMGPKVGLHRFSDIWMGISLLRGLWEKNQTLYTGLGKIRHSRASDVFKNLAQESEGLRLNEDWWVEGDEIHPYFGEYRKLREQYQARMEQLLRV